MSLCRLGKKKLETRVTNIKTITGQIRTCRRGGNQRKNEGKKKIIRQRERGPSHVVRTGDKLGDIPGEAVSMARGY